MAQKSKQEVKKSVEVKKVVKTEVKVVEKPIEKPVEPPVEPPIENVNKTYSAHGGWYSLLSYTKDGEYVISPTGNPLYFRSTLTATSKEVENFIENSPEFKSGKIVWNKVGVASASEIIKNINEII